LLPSDFSKPKRSYCPAGCAGKDWCVIWPVISAPFSLDPPGSQARADRQQNAVASINTDRNWLTGTLATRTVVRQGCGTLDQPPENRNFNPGGRGAVLDRALSPISLGPLARRPVGSGRKPVSHCSVQHLRKALAAGCFERSEVQKGRFDGPGSTGKGPSRDGRSKLVVADW
jgi:hypothetical protein